MWRAVQSQAFMHERIRIKDRILAGSHLVKEDSGLELWSTPKGDYWIPKSNRYVLAFNLAGMLRAELEDESGSGWDLRRLQQTVLKAGARVAGHRPIHRKTASAPMFSSCFFTLSLDST